MYGALFFEFRPQSYLHGALTLEFRPQSYPILFLLQNLVPKVVEDTFSMEFETGHTLKVFHRDRLRIIRQLVSTCKKMFCKLNTNVFTKCHRVRRRLREVVVAPCSRDALLINETTGQRASLATRSDSSSIFAATRTRNLRQPRCSAFQD